MPSEHGKEVLPEWLGLTPDQMPICVACGCPPESCKCAEVQQLSDRVAVLKGRTPTMTPQQIAARLGAVIAKLQALAGYGEQTNTLPVVAEAIGELQAVVGELSGTAPVAEGEG